MLVRSRRSCGFGFYIECTQSYVRRTIWAGSQELYEIQMPDEPIVREYDTQIPATKLADGNLYDPNPMYGRVAYTFGLKLDQPLTVTRLGYKNSFNETWSPFSIVPLWTVRGTADTSYFAATGAKNCNTKRCVLVGYSAEYWTPAYSQYYVPNMFQGTLLSNKSDHTGQLYRRNRYYDPATGRFTQEDPIGLAGGLNLYGFANGDPVNFSDPFGLMACKDANGKEIPCPEPPGGPPVKLPDGKNGKPNEWVKIPGSEGGSRGAKYKPRYAVPSPTGAQPGSSWDPAGHWDADDGSGGRKRYAPDGTEVDHDNEPVAMCGPGCKNAASAAAAVGTGYLIYRGLRMVPSLFPVLWPTIPANAVIP